MPNFVKIAQTAAEICKFQYYAISMLFLFSIAMLYFTYLWRSPHWTDVHKNLFSDVLDVITCAKSQNEIFTGYDFAGGRIFQFSIDF